MKEKERMLIKVAGRSLQFSVFIKFSICLIRGSSGSCHNVILSLMTKGATIQFRRRNSLKISNHVIWLALCNIFLVRTLSQPLEKIDENVPKGCPPPNLVWSCFLSSSAAWQRETSFHFVFSLVATDYTAVHVTRVCRRLLCPEWIPFFASPPPSTFVCSVSLSTAPCAVPRWC